MGEFGVKKNELGFIWVRGAVHFFLPLLFVWP